MTDRVAEFLARFEGSRASVIDQALREIGARLNEDRIVAAELAWEVGGGKLWQQVTREDGSPFEDAATYFQERLGFSSKARLQQYIRVGRFLHTLPKSERPDMRLRLAEIGMLKADLVASVAQYRPREVNLWIDRAKVTRRFQLREIVQAAIHPKGRPGRGAKPGSNWPARTRLHAHLDPLGVPPHLVDDLYEVGRAACADDAKAIMVGAIGAALERWTTVRKRA